MLTDKEKKEITDLYKNDKNVSEISRITKKSRNTINEVLKNSDVDLDIKPQTKSDNKINDKEYYIDKLKELGINEEMILPDTLKILGADELTNFKINYKGVIIKKLYNVEPSEFIDKIFSKAINLGMELDIQGELEGFINKTSQTDELKKLWMSELIEASKPVEESEEEPEIVPEKEPDPMTDMILYYFTHGNLEGYERLKNLRDNTPSRKGVIEIPKTQKENERLRDIIFALTSETNISPSELELLFKKHNIQMYNKGIQPTTVMGMIIASLKASDLSPSELKALINKTNLKMKQKELSANDLELKPKVDLEIKPNKFPKFKNNKNKEKSE